MKTLIIAEKPSVAKDIAQALGLSFSNGFFQNEQTIVSFCLGHLVALNGYSDNHNTLPIIPKQFNLEVIERGKEQFEVLQRLLNDKEVAVVVNACDAGREGELIFRLVYEKANCTKPVLRMWLQSMTPEAIQKAWQDKKDASLYDNLGQAAKARSQADWIIGINGSRLMRSPIGRVMTPTLALVVERYCANTQFKPTDFFKLKATLKTEQGQQYEAFLIADDDNQQEFSSEEQGKAKLETFVIPSEAKVSDETKTQKKNPPLLFDLTTLQREANKKLGYSAALTLKTAQALYETHKAITYPRTDASALPSDYKDEAKRIIEILSKTHSYEQYASALMAQPDLDNKPHVFNDKAISDHFAIIPTGKLPVDMNEQETALLRLIIQRFIATFYPPALFEKTTRIVQIEQNRFKVSANVLLDKGWLAVYGTEEENKATAQLPPSQVSTLTSLTLEKSKTAPPPLYTEADLLNAMQNAGKYVEDEQASLAIKEKGIGTPATRAPIIEKLKQEYMEVKNNRLTPTKKGLELIECLKARYVPITSAKLTGQWESQLSDIEKGKVQADIFMQTIVQSTYDFCEAVKQNPVPDMRYPSIGGCPCCEAPLLNRKFSHQCEKCGFSISKEISQKKLTEKDIEDILKKGKTKLISGFIAKSGKSFNAKLVVNTEERKLNFVFEKTK